jgi:Tol biopolymer transport system component
MVLGRRLRRRFVIAGLAATLAAPVAAVQPAAAAILFTCDSVTGSGTLSPGLVHDPSAQSLSSGSTAPAGPADITVASATADGVKSNGYSDYPALSADGTKVAFHSSATNLDPEAPSGGWFVKDLITGALTLLPPFVETAPSLSADGTKVAFATSVANLDPRDTDTNFDVYVKDLTTGELTLASTSEAGVKANGGVGAARLSGDGTKVAFGGQATNLHPNDVTNDDDVYVKNLINGNIKLASTSTAGVKGNRGGSITSLSGDGRRVAFISNSTNFDPRATNTDLQVYVKDLPTGDLTLASTTDSGVPGNDGSFDASLSGDGTKVAFASYATNLDPADTEIGFDVYVKNLITGDLILASTSDTGFEGSSYSTGGGRLSGDGTKVAFRTQVSLDPADTLREDVYVKDVTTGDVTLASTSDTGVKGNRMSKNPSLSADGTKVAFASYAINLDPADTDGNPDLYVKELPAIPTSITISGCSNGTSGTVSIVDIRSYGPRPLGCPTSLGGAAGNDYVDTTPILVGPNPRFEIDWATGPNSYGVAAVNAGPTPTQWRVRFAITASPGHDTPATNQYLPAAGSGATKTRLQGKLDWSALDSFNCTTGIDDPLSWVTLANNGSWIAKAS